MPHPNEPTLEELLDIRLKLEASPVTVENTKKLSALEEQIKRRERL